MVQKPTHSRSSAEADQASPGRRRGLLARLSLVLLLLAITACVVPGLGERPPGPAGTVVAVNPTPMAPAPTGPSQGVPRWRQGKAPPGIAGTLYGLVLAEQDGVLDEAARSFGIVLDGDHVRVSIKARPGQIDAAEAAAKAVSKRGKPIQRLYTSFEAYVPVSSLLALKQHPAISSISEPNTFKTTDKVGP